MHRPWTNPFPEKPDNFSCENGGGDLSGEDDESFPDQIVYHDEEHLANLFRLYNRPEEDKKPVTSDVHTNKTGYSDLGHKSDSVFPVRPSMQEIAEELGGSHYDCRRLNNLDNTGPEMPQDLDVFLEHDVGAMNALQANQSMEHRNENKELQNSKDVWDHAKINAGLHDMEHMVSLPAKVSQMTKQPKEMHKKRVSFRFRAVKHMELESNIRQKSDQKLSLTDQLLNLETSDEPHNAISNLGNGTKTSIPSVNTPITNRLFELVQQSAQSEVQEVKDLIKPTDLPNESIHRKLQKVLQEAPPVSTERINVHGKDRGSIYGFTGRLQKVLGRQRNERAAFLRMLQTNVIIGHENCMEVKILNKSLEACFASCLCKVVKLPQSYMVDGVQTSAELTVIFNLQTNADLELEIGNIVRIYPPWRELGRTILCTYFCENVARTLL